ncbi:MAG TPA: hypothetical protein VHD83_04165 [Puia sp.]|nr:hypothetical protein [Puia sp.]
MRKLIFFLIWLFFADDMSGQEVCDDAAIMSKTGSWKQHSDANMQGGKDMTAVNHCLDRISQLFQSAYPDLKGMEATWHRGMSDPLFAGAPTAYEYISEYKAWYCNVHVHQLMLSGETGTWAYVFVNSLVWFFQDEREPLKLNGSVLYMLPVKKGSWKGYDLYQPYFHREASCIVLTRGGRIPWKPVTQEQYLGVCRAFLEGQKKQFPNLSWLDQKIQTIDNYLHASSVASLQQPAVVLPRDKYDFKGGFSTEDKGGCQMVVLNPTYFSLSGSAPQLMVLYWRWEKNVAAQYFKKQLEEHFPVDKLQGMIDGLSGGIKK